MPYNQLIFPLIRIESTVKIIKDTIAVIPIIIRENKYRLRIWADFFIGKVPYNLLKLLRSVIENKTFSIKATKVRVTIILVPKSATIPKIIGTSKNGNINLDNGFIA